MANKNPNTSGLDPVRTKIEARKRGKNGGIKSGIVRKENKALQDAATESLNKKLANGLTLQENFHKIFEDRIIYLAQHPEDVRGSDIAYTLEAYKTYRDTSGQKPVDKIQTIDPPTIVFDFPKGEDNGESEP